MNVLRVLPLSSLNVWVRPFSLLSYTCGLVGYLIKRKGRVLQSVKLKTHLWLLTEKYATLYSAKWNRSVIPTAWASCFAGKHCLSHKEVFPSPLGLSHNKFNVLLSLWDLFKSVQIRINCPLAPENVPLRDFGSALNASVRFAVSSFAIIPSRALSTKRRWWAVQMFVTVNRRLLSH